jgi:hypothetical protein
MTPEKAEAVLRALSASFQGFIEELETIDAMRPAPTPAVQHLLCAMKQTKVSLDQLIGRGL